MQRRSFLKLTGSFAASATLPGLLSSCDLDFFDDRAGFSFPQGVASGDPRASSVVLWTRLQPLPQLDSTEHSVTLEVALDASFTTLVVRQHYTASALSDYTLRIYVDSLQADTFYHYRFVAPDGSFSRNGRTLTAPTDVDPRDLRFAFFSCQDRGHGFYRAYRHLLDEDQLAPPDRQLRFVLHLGDFVYETRNDDLQAPIDAAFDPLPGGLIDSHGVSRGVDEYPDGAFTSGGVHHATTLGDYRHLYRQYLRDPELQSARARWPFVHIWDDHEFSDDCWQTEANYENAGPDSDEDEPAQRRKVAANQAWFEYTPVDFRAPDESQHGTHHASEFAFAEVQNTPNTRVDEDNFADNADNRAAIDTLTIYRNFRYGANVEMILTDNRSYRSDHAIPEDLSGNLSAFVHPRVALPTEIVNQLDAGRTDNDGDPDFFLFLGTLVLNPRRNSPPGSVLGARQKAWWKSVLRGSNARWKLWANSIPLMRMGVNLKALGLDLPDLLLSGDSWDGYATERRELVQFILDNDIANVVSLAGDVHAHYCGVVMDDYDAATPSPGLIEAVCASVSSPTQFAAAERFLRDTGESTIRETLRRLVTYDARYSDTPGSEPFVNNLNNTLLNGADAGLAAATSNTAEAIDGASDPDASPHLRFADTNAHGYGIVEVSSERVDIALVSVDDITSDPDVQAVRASYSAHFGVPAREHAGEAAMPGPEFVGDRPFPFSIADPLA